MARRAIGAVDAAVAAGYWVVVTALLLAVPLFEAADPTTDIVGPRPASAVWWVCLATTTVQAAVLVLVRSRPRASLLAVAALPLPLAVVGAGDLYTLTSAAVSVAVYLAVTVQALRALAPVLVGAGVLVAVGQAVDTLVGGVVGLETALTAGLVQAAGVVGVPLLLAAAVTGRRDARDARRLEAQASDREQDALVRAAVADERTAMARELHDIAAHHLSGIALMAAAIDRQVDADPEAAKRSAREVRAESTAVLEDLRRLVGLLRTDPVAARGVHSMAGLPELVERRRAAGVPVELRSLPGGAGPLGTGVGPIAQLALYRIAQESLANAATHAPGSAVVVEVDDRDTGALTLTVTNGRGARETAVRRGFGLVGMRERADLVGATLQHGPTPDGGWEVRVTVPRDASYASPSLEARDEVAL